MTSGAPAPNRAALVVDVCSSTLDEVRVRGHILSYPSTGKWFQGSETTLVLAEELDTDFTCHKPSFTPPIQARFNQKRHESFLGTFWP